DEILRLLRTHIANGCAKDENGHWTEDQNASTWRQIRERAAAGLPQILHEKTLVLVIHMSPHYVAMLSADEQGCLHEVGESTVRAIEAEHYSAVQIGEDYTPVDYADYLHFTESGGVRLAAEVAKRIH